MITLAISQERFLLRVELLVKHDKLTYLESICQIARELDVEPDEIAHMVTGPLKEKIKIQAKGFQNPLTFA